MDDLISRQAAIDAVTSWLNKACYPLNQSSYNEGEIAAYETALWELKKIPSAERKTGRWIPCKELAREMLADRTVGLLYDHYECSLCGCTLPNPLYNQDGEPFFKFCPNCGARMKGEADEH